MGLSVWARKGSISDYMANLYQVCVFESVNDIFKGIKSYRKEGTKPSWTSILDSYTSLYTKLSKNFR